MSDIEKMQLLGGKTKEGTTPVFRDRYAIQQVIADEGYEIFKALKEELR